MRLFLMLTYWNIYCSKHPWKIFLQTSWWKGVDGSCTSLQYNGTEHLKCYKFLFTTAREFPVAGALSCPYFWCHSNLPFGLIQPLSVVHGKPISSNNHPTIRPACFSLLVSPRSHLWIYFTVSLLLFPFLVSFLTPPISDCGLAFQTWAKGAPGSRAPQVQLLAPASWDFNTGPHSVTPPQPTGASWGFPLLCFLEARSFTPWVLLGSLVLW